MQQSQPINDTYTICHGQLLGKGSTGNVFLGQQTQNPGNRVAIKEIDLTSINNEVTRYLLSCEIAALNNLGKIQNTGHPNIVKLFDIVMDRNMMYLVMELLEGGTLGDHIKQHPNGLPQEEALNIFSQMIEGYLRVKNKQIIHRDLKPDNILFKVAPHMSKNIAIIDFGYCTMQEVPNKPQVYYNVGSPKYMAPEAYKKNQYSQKSDVWALGVMLYQMLLGYTCDKGLTMDAYLDLLEKRGVPIPDKMKSFPQHLIANMLNFNPQQRFGVEQIVNQLQIYQNGGQRGERIQSGRQQIIRQNSLGYLRNTMKQGQIMTMRANRNQILFHSMLPQQQQAPLTRNHEYRQFRSDSRLQHNQNISNSAPRQQNQGPNQQPRVISFHFDNQRNNNDQAPILGRVENVDLNSVRQLIHRRQPQPFPQNKTNTAQTLIKQSTMFPLNTQSGPQLPQQQQNSHSGYLRPQQQNQMGPNDRVPFHMGPQTPQQQENNDMKQPNFMSAPAARQENRTFFNNSITPKGNLQPSHNVQVNVFHPPSPQQQQQQQQQPLQNRPFQSQVLQQQMPAQMGQATFKKKMSQGPVQIAQLLNQNPNIQPSEQPRPRIQGQMNFFDGRRPVEQRFSHNLDTMPYRNLNDSVNLNPQLQQSVRFTHNRAPTERQWPQQNVPTMLKINPNSGRPGTIIHQSHVQQQGPPMAMFRQAVVHQ